MRIAAGILMIIGTVMSFAAFGSIPGEPQKHIAFGLIFIYLGLTLSGGIFALKRKYWKLCFTSSLLLTLLLIYSFFFLPVTSTWFLLPSGILPIIFVCLRKSEWQENSA
jgi:hypothetical protein